jgi:hypothetical protein
LGAAAAFLGVTFLATGFLAVFGLGALVAALAAFAMVVDERKSRRDGDVR